MKIITRLDLMIGYSCNVSCAGCISLSNFPRKGIESYENIKRSIEYWSPHLFPNILSVFGGEPLLHPKLELILDCISKNWPTSTIRLITNGYLLDRFDPNIWFKYKNFEMQISIHRHDHEKLINEKIHKILKVKNNWKVKKYTNGHKQVGWINQNIEIYKSKFKDFNPPYQYIDGKILPYNSNPIKSHSICACPDTPILFRDGLYKCAAIANLMDLSNEYSYKPITNYKDLNQITDYINVPEQICSICPENDSNVIDHFNKENVNVKNIS